MTAGSATWTAGTRTARPGPRIHCLTVLTGRSMINWSAAPRDPQIVVLSAIRAVDPAIELDDTVDVVIEDGRITRVGAGAATAEMKKSERALVIEAMQAARALGKQAEADALAWARRGAQSAREALGADSPTTIKFEAIVKAWAHALAMGQPLPG